MFYNFILEADVKTFPKGVDVIIDFSNNPHGRYQLDVNKGDEILGRYYYNSRKQAQSDESELLRLLND